LRSSGYIIGARSCIPSCEVAVGYFIDHLILQKRIFEAKAERLADISIKSMRLSRRAENCLLRAGYFTVDDLVGITEADLKRIRHLGAKSIQEILEARDMLLPQSTSSSRQGSTHACSDLLFHLQAVARDYQLSKFDFFKSCDIALDYLQRSGVSALSDLSMQSFSVGEQAIIHPFVSRLRRIVCFEQHFNNLDEREKHIILLRSNGKTLQEVGDSLGVTRERVRQIEAKSARRLATVAAAAVTPFFEVQKKLCPIFFEEIIADDSLARSWLFILRKQKHISFVEGFDLYVRAPDLKGYCEKAFRKKVREIVGSGASLKNVRHEALRILRKRYRIPLDENDVDRYLLARRYKISSDWIAGTKRHLRDIATQDVIQCEFDSIIDTACSREILRFRESMRDAHPMVDLPPEDKRLIGDIVRISRFAQASNSFEEFRIYFEKYKKQQLLDSIKLYINDSHQYIFYFPSLYRKFKNPYFSDAGIGGYFYFCGLVRRNLSFVHDIKRRWIIRQGALEKELHNFSLCEMGNASSDFSSIFQLLNSDLNELRKVYLGKLEYALDSPAEGLMMALIHEVIKESRFSMFDVVSHVPLKLLFCEDAELRREERFFIRNVLSHIDFLIISKDDNLPLLAIEVDGGYHRTEECQKRRDELKDSIFEHYSIPLLRFCTTGRYEYKRLTDKLQEVLVI